MKKVTDTIAYELDRQDIKSAVINYLKFHGINTEFKKVTIEPKYIQEEIRTSYHHDCDYNDVFDGLKVTMSDKMDHE